MPKRKGAGMSLGEVEKPQRKRTPRNTPLKAAFEELTPKQLKKRLWSKAQTLVLLQEALESIPPKLAVWEKIFRQYAQCRGFYAEPAQIAGNNLTQVIAVRHFDSDEQFYAEAKKQQMKLIDKNKKVIEQMEAERELKSAEEN